MKRVLAIDDNELNLVLLEQIFKTYYPEFQFLRASTGQEGVEVAQDEQPEIILLDILMPDMNGYEVCKILKGNTLTRHIPVLMISALGQNPVERTKGLNLGADAFISKPFSQDELIAQINVVLRIKKAEDLLIKRNESLERYQKKLKKLNTELTIAEERERRRIAENLHDSLGQTLSLIYIKLSSIMNEQVNPEMKQTLEETSGLLNKAITESRILTYDLSPPVLYELGLIPAFEWKLGQIEEKYGIKTVLIGETEKINIKKEFDIFVYRIVAELLSNVIKHAHADLIEIKVKKDKEFYYISVRDNGVGFKNKVNKKATMQGGFGLMSIIERLENIKGHLEIKSHAVKGTIASLRIPVN